MKCLDNEEKSECSQVVKLKLKLICFTFLVGSVERDSSVERHTCAFFSSVERDTCAFNRAEA